MYTKIGGIFLYVYYPLICPGAVLYPAHSFSGRQKFQTESEICSNLFYHLFHLPQKAFMMELTAHQSSVGNVLQAGNQLIAQGNLTEEEEDEIREQMTLLNSRWESLRVASMDRQAR